MNPLQSVKDERAGYRSLLPKKPAGLPSSSPTQPSLAGQMALSLLAAVGLAWSLFGPWPWLCTPVGVVVPIWCWMLASRPTSRYTISILESARRLPNLGLALYCSMLSLGIAAWRDFHPLVWDAALGWTLLVSILLGTLTATIVARIDPEAGDTPMMVLSAALASIWVAGLTLEASGWMPPIQRLDRSAVVVDTVDSSRFPSVEVAGLGMTNLSLPVSRRILESLRVGDLVCVSETQSVIRVRWRRLKLCRPPSVLRDDAGGAGS